MVKGFKVEISRFKDFNSKVYSYYVSKIEARKRKKELLKLFRETMNGLKWFGRVVEVELFKCNNEWCNELTEEEDSVCEGCDKLLADSYAEAK